ncbi:hypothetical protein BY458DRAFT_524117 [Sporodiniella umbellata]|nr:hypothetical protein BY458DRAFT_524117 [Sporodiniella umbellata]
MSYSDYSEESDEEYAELTMSGWGTQTNSNGTTEVTVSVQGWESLIDPSVQVKGNGVGSGQLHRKGKNFNPVDEQLILDRRLGKPLPKGGLNGATKKKKKGKSNSGYAPPSSNHHPRFTAPAKTTPAKTAPPPSHNRGRPPIAPGASPWATSSLVETPFWEKPNGSSASKYASQPSSQPNAYAQPTSYSPSASQPVSRAQHSQPPSSQSAYSSQNSQGSRPLQGSAASKYADPQPAYTPPPSWTPPPQQPQWDPSHSSSNLSKWASPSQPNYYPPQPPQFQAPQTFSPANNTLCIKFSIALAPGVTAELPVYANDNPTDVVNGFERKHQLVMSADAKAKFAERVALLLHQHQPRV